jgi:hypothetical protein
MQQAPDEKVPKPALKVKYPLWPCHQLQPVARTVVGDLGRDML